MKNLTKLIIQDLLVQNKVYNTSKYFLMYYVFCLLSITLINSYENIVEFGMLFTLICIPLGFLSVLSSIIKCDIEDGFLELLKTIHTSFTIICIKYCALTIAIMGSFIITIPIIYILFNLKLSMLLIVTLCASLLILLSSALSILIGSIQGYFRVNTNFFALILLPLVIPSIILSGMILNHMIHDHIHYDLIYILLGIDLIIIPVSLYLSTYLIENIYNI